MDRSQKELCLRDIHLYAENLITIQTLTNDKKEEVQSILDSCWGSVDFSPQKTIANNKYNNIIIDT